MKLGSLVGRVVVALALLGCGSHDEHGPGTSEPAAHRRPPERAAPPEPPPSAPESVEHPAELTASQVALARTRCNASGARECWLLGAMYERGEGEPVDAAQARRLYEQACALPGGFGCDDLARLDPDNAEAHLAVGCDAGRTTSCATLGQRDPVAGARRIERACTLGDIEACVAVTRVLHDATPPPSGAATEMSRLPASVTNATVRAAARRCDENMASMCAWLAVQYLEEGPFGVPVDPEHALELSRRACNDEALGGCLLVGEILVIQQSDVATAGTAFNRSCAAGNAEACDAIATVLTGVDEARDDIALARFEACLLGIAEDCSGPT